MRWMLAAPLLLLLGGCKEEPPPAAPAAPAPEPTPAPAAPSAVAPGATGKGAPEAEDRHVELRWQSTSDEGTIVTQTADASGACQVTCRTGGLKGPVQWRSARCIGKRVDLRFVSADCSRVVVVHQLPEVSATSTNWQGTSVVHVYERDRLDYAVAAGTMVRDWRRVRSAGNTFYWLAGALGVPGQKPRYAADGSAVELETIDGIPQRIPLVVTRK